MFEKLYSLVKKAKSNLRRSIVKDWINAQENDDKYIIELTSSLDDEIGLLEEQLGENSYQIPALMEFEEFSGEDEFRDFEERLKRHIEANSGILSNLSRYKNTVSDEILKEYFSSYKRLMEHTEEFKEREK